jgi:hypothetical protein
VKPSQRLLRDLEELIGFRDAFVALLNESERSPESYSGRIFRWVPRPGRETEWARLRGDVAIAAGSAAGAVDRLGLSLIVKPAPMTGQAAYSLNPIAAWSSALEPPNDFTVENVLDTVTQVIGRVERLRREAEITERSFAGKLTRFFGLPGEVREAMSPQGRRGVPAAVGFWGTIVAEIIATLSATALLALFGVLVAKLF